MVMLCSDMKHIVEDAQPALSSKVHLGCLAVQTKDAPLY